MNGRVIYLCGIAGHPANSPALDSVAEAGWQVVVPDLPKVTQPLLYFRSSVDHVIDASSSRTVLSAVSSRDVEERILEDSYHVATLDNDAATIFEESLQFVHAASHAQHPE